MSPVTQRLVDLAKIIVNQGDIAVIYVGEHVFRARKIADLGGVLACEDQRGMTFMVDASAIVAVLEVQTAGPSE
jgi:hypothetical protein